MKFRDLLRVVPALLAQQEGGTATLPPSATGVLRGLGITIEEGHLDPPTAAGLLAPTLEVADPRRDEPPVGQPAPDGLAVKARRRTPVPTPDDDETTLGRYELGAELGRGGMGRVVEAADGEIGRTVAIKMLLHPSQVSDETLARFVAEARITGQLQHPNIVPVYEMGVTSRGQFYFVMKRVVGKSLLDVLRELRKGDPEAVAEWTTHRLLTVFVQVCNAVAYAHDRRLVHRDLKPDNIMVGRFGEVLVMDWGIARVMGPTSRGGLPSPRPTFDSRVAPPEPTDEHTAPVRPAVDVHTQAGATFGTPGYMSPEQAQGRMDELDERSDVWSLGAILYQLLTLRRAYFHRDPVKLMRLAAKASPPDPRDRGRYVADEIADICIRAMSLDPADRHRTADELGRGVRAFLDGSLAREKASTHVEDAVRAWKRYTDQQDATRELEDREAVLQSTTAAWAPLSAKTDLFAVRMRRAAEEPLLMEAFGDLVAACEQALALDPQNEQARGLLAKAFWARHQEAEREGDTAGERYYRARLLAFDDGHYAGALREGGRLTLHTDPPGAAAYAARIDRRGVTWTLGEEDYLGLTPLEGVSLPVGSYRIRLVRGGKRDTIYPVRLRRGGHWTSGDAKIPLFDDETIGEGFVYIPRGPFEFGGEGAWGAIRPRSLRGVDGFFASVYAVTMAEYAVFLTALHRKDSDAAWKRVPRQESGFRTAGGQYWPRPPDGAAYYLPDEDRDGDAWDATWPVFSVAWEDAVAYADWAGDLDGIAYSLPTERQWEKAARGVDGRRHPWGDQFDPALCKMRDSQPGRPFPEPVGKFATDRSIYGVHDLGGSARDWCADLAYNGDPERRPVRGGGWDSGAAQARATYRTGFHSWRVASDVGFRLVRPLPEPTR
jgi:serine/threonine-protein kinase